LNGKKSAIESAERDSSRGKRFESIGEKPEGKGRSDHQGRKTVI